MTDDWEFPEFELLERLKRIKEQNNFKLKRPEIKNREIIFCNLVSTCEKQLSFFIYSDNKPALYLIKADPYMTYTHKEYPNPTDEQIIESIRWFFE